MDVLLSSFVFVRPLWKNPVPREKDRVPRLDPTGSFVGCLGGQLGQLNEAVSHFQINGHTSQGNNNGVGGCSCGAVTSKCLLFDIQLAVGSVPEHFQLGGITEVAGQSLTGRQSHQGVVSTRQIRL